MNPQPFKQGDALEAKFAEAGRSIADNLSLQRSEFTAAAYTAYSLGDLLYSMKRAPLTNAVPQEIFRESFAVIFNSFVEAGSFESYLTVFRSIFGDSVEVTFTVPAPGKLNIDIVAAGLVLYDLMVGVIEDNALVLYELVDDEDDNIAVQAVKGFDSQYELEQMLFEMVPAGIYTEISLTVGV